MDMDLKILLMSNVLIILIFSTLIISLQEVSFFLKREPVGEEHISRLMVEYCGGSSRLRVLFLSFNL